MSTFYLDFVNGNDANDGTTWAKAWKTITSGATAARIAPGDVIRLAKSGDPSSIGNATWTNLSATVTLASAQTTTVSTGDTTWTAANSGAATTSTTRKQGTNSAQLTTAAATATATKYAYFATGTLDLSAYDSITFWIQNTSSAIADANRYVIKLCSDTTGDTPVDEFPIPAIASTSQWVPLTISKSGGGNLSNSIKSIAWYTGSSSPGNSNAVLLDNIEACTAAGLNLTALISKNSAASGGTDTWHGLQSILGTTVILGNRNSDGATATLQGYYTKGTTPETVTTYIRPTIKMTMQSSSTATASAIQDSGTAGNYITFSGGWNTGTDTQDGETWIDGQNGFGNGISQNSQTYIKINRWNLCRFNYGLAQAANTTALTNWLVENIIVTNCSVAMTGYLSTSTITATVNNNGSGIADGGNGNTTFKSTANIKSLNNLSSDTFGYSLNFYYPSIERYNCAGGGITVAPSNIDYLEQDRAGGIIKNVINGSYVNYGLLYIKELKLSNSSQTALTGYGVVINKATVTAMTTLGGMTNLQIKQLAGATTQLIGSDFAAGSGLNANADIQPTAFYNNVNNVTTDNRAYWKYGNALSQTTTRHTASGVAWQINITSVEQTSVYPCMYPIARIAVNAGSQVTVKAWVKLSHATNIGAKLAILANEIAGVSADVTATKAADTNWEQLTINFNPTVAGVAQIYVLAYWLASTANQSVYVDDITVSQA